MFHRSVELQHLTRGMNEHAAPGHKRLQNAIEAFGRSPRFSLFKGVQVGRLMPEGCQIADAVSGLTFEQLLSQADTLGSAQLSLGPEQEEGLFQLLVALGEESEPTALAPDDDISVVVPDSFTSIDIPTMDAQLKLRDTTAETEPPRDVPVGSVPLELAMRSSLAQIVSHQRYDRVRTRTIGEFWDREWASAPFEEAMTIEQLAGLDLAVLFKKRMVTDTRIQNIVRALGRVQAYLMEPSNPTVERLRTGTETTSATSRRGQISARGPVGALWALDPQLSLAAQAVVEVLTGMPDVPETTSETLAEVLSEVSQRFSAAECAAIVLGEKIAERTQRDLKKIVERAMTTQERDVVRALFAAPAVRIEHVALVLSGVGSTTSARSLCLAALVARGLGASRIPSNSVSGGECWTLDSFLQRTRRAQGVGKTARTEKRNRLNKRHRRSR